MLLKTSQYNVAASKKEVLDTHRVVEPVNGPKELEANFWIIVEAVSLEKFRLRCPEIITTTTFPIQMLAIYDSDCSRGKLLFKF